MSVALQPHLAVVPNQWLLLAWLGTVTELYCNLQGVVESELACRLRWHPVLDGLSSFKGPTSQAGKSMTAGTRTNR